MLHTEILSFSGSLKLRFSFTRKTQDFSVQHPGSLSISFTGKKLKDLLTRKKFPVSPPNVHQEKFTSKKKKKWKTAPPKARPYTRTTKSFSLPRKRQEQASFISIKNLQANVKFLGWMLFKLFGDIIFDSWIFYD